MRHAAPGETASRRGIDVVTRWTDSTEPNETLIAQRFRDEGLEPAHWSNGPDFHYAEHSHDYHKVLYCIRGDIVFALPESGESLHLEPGDRLDLPPGTRHSARVGPTGVLCMEAARH